MYRPLAAFILSLAIPAAALSEVSDQPSKRERIGYGLMFSNDLLGDGKDRWRTGSLTSSRLYGYSWNGVAPRRLGELLELRIQGQIIAPQDLGRVESSDRPWAGALTVQLQTHAQRGATQIDLGAGLTAVGPQTHLDDLQDWLHDAASAPTPSDAVLAGQVGNKIRPVFSAEVGHTVSLSPQASLRPFVEARAGDETYVRAGFDMTFGQMSQGGLKVRESVTGQRYRTMQSDATGLALTAGADIAYVSDSIYLPDSSGYELEQERHRARIGVQWQGQNAAAFYGLTYLGREFSTQEEGQISGSLQLKLRF